LKAPKKEAEGNPITPDAAIADAVNVVAVFPVAYAESIFFIEYEFSTCFGISCTSTYEVGLRV
jgi:hypothetical protein